MGLNDAAEQLQACKAEVVRLEHELSGVLGDIAAERRRQDAKWGEQNHPAGTGEAWETQHGRGFGEARAEADFARQYCEDASGRGEVTWALILEEEVAEALAEDDPAKLRAELIQVAAVATQWVEAIDRREARS